MSFRGRGRGGRGRGGGGFGYDHPAKHAPHENFPEITLPEMDFKASKEERALIVSTLKLEEFWRTSCYYLEEDAPKKKNEDREIERFSDRKRKQSRREALSSYLKLTPSNFPAELVQGSKRGQASNKKLRWDKDSDEQAFEAFEKLEQKHKAGAGLVREENTVGWFEMLVETNKRTGRYEKHDGSKVEKEGDDEEEQEEEEVQEEEENSDDDYNQNIEFDDDDDDWNQEEEAQEDFYD